MQNDNNAQPDTPPPSGGCCSKIAAFLAIGPWVRLGATVAGIDFAIELSVGRRARAT